MWFTIDGETTFVVESVNSLGWGKYSIEFRSKGRPGQWAVHRDVKVSGSDLVILLEPTKQEIFDEGYAYHKETAKLLSYLSGDLNKIRAEFSEEEEEQKSVVEPPKNYDLDF